jgi:hypothetical protein
MLRRIHTTFLITHPPSFIGIVVICNLINSVHQSLDLGATRT